MTEEPADPERAALWRAVYRERFGPVYRLILERPPRFHTDIPNVDTPEDKAARRAAIAYLPGRRRPV